MAGTSLRRLGVYGANLPVKRNRSVVASDFLIGGIMGQFERKYNTSFLINNAEEFQAIFGNHVISTYYGCDAIQGFFANVGGVDAKLYVASYLGNSAGVIDAVSASRSISDKGSEASLSIGAGYQEEVEYGTSGNRTAVKLTAATRFSTQASATVAATGVSLASLDSVIGIKVGDLVTFAATGGTPGSECHKITAVDESAKTIAWSGDFSSSAASLAVDDDITVEGFLVQTYRKDVNGVQTEVETELGRVVCTMEPEVTDFYAPNVHADNSYIILSDLVSSSTLADREFADDASPVYLTAGSDGTSPSDSASWDNTLSLFDDDPVRILANPETSLVAVHSAGELYCQNREDNPIWLTTMTEDQSKSQLLDSGHGYQRSDEVDMILVANWLKVEDPFSSSVLTPPRQVPNVGHVMGCWIRSIGRNGIHYVPAVKTIPVRGVVGVVGEQFLSDYDRTDLAEAGVNLIQKLDGIGIIIRNFFTPSTDVAYQFGNGIIMRNYVKVSAVDSLQLSENQPNSINFIKADKMAVLQFLYRLWERGSTGNIATGETFGQSEDESGLVTSPEDHFEVKADLVNNPQSSINAGERNIDTWFTYPSPAGSIKVGVGIALRS